MLKLLSAVYPSSRCSDYYSHSSATGSTLELFGLCMMAQGEGKSLCGRPGDQVDRERHARNMKPTNPVFSFFVGSSALQIDMQ